jgi:hypothetical protein
MQSVADIAGWMGGKKGEDIRVLDNSAIATSKSAQTAVCTSSFTVLSDHYTNSIQQVTRRQGITDSKNKLYATRLNRAIQ